MKMKIIKHKGFQQLVVDEYEVNNLYGGSYEQPIVLAMISNYGENKFWRVKDFRLVENANNNANPFFSDYSIQNYTPTSEADSQNLKSKLKSYIEEDGVISWSTKDGILTPGDEANNPDLPRKLKELGDYTWSFREAQKKLSELKIFWENYNEKDLSNIAIENTERQINIVDYGILVSKIKNKMRCS